MTVVQVLYAVLWGFVYVYITKLEKTGCECSEDWKRDYIKVYVMVMIPLLIMRIFDLLPKVVMGLTVIFTLFFIFVTYRYIHELKEKKCACSNAPTRDVLEIVNYIQIFFIAFAVLLIVGVLLLGIRMPSKLNSAKLKSIKNKNR